MFST
jgi:hypothetical protein